MRTRARAAAAALTTIAATGGLTLGLVGPAAADKPSTPATVVTDVGTISAIGNLSLYTAPPCAQGQVSQVVVNSPAGTIQFGGGFTNTCKGVAVGVDNTATFQAKVSARRDSLEVRAKLPGTSFDPATQQSKNATIDFAGTWRAAGTPVSSTNTTETTDAAGCRVVARVTETRTPATVTGTLAALGLSVPFTAPKVPNIPVASASWLHTETVTTRHCPPHEQEDCKDGGWSSYTVPRSFKNQGDCIQFVNTGR